MAEILLKIDDGSSYKDGDVLDVFNRHRIRCCHAQHLCRLGDDEFTRHDLRPNSSLGRDFRELTYQYRFERLNYSAEVRRIEIATGIEEIFTNKPNARGECIHVEEFLERRLEHDSHAIFGSPGNEVWYGGQCDFSDAALDKVWGKIAEKHGVLESEEEFSLWPMGRLDIRHHLAVRVEDFSNDEAQQLIAPQLAFDKGGRPVWELIEEVDGAAEATIVASDDQPDDRPWVRKVEAKRNVTIDWRRELLDDLRVTEADVLDREIPIGRDIELKNDQWRHESKEQPVQPIKDDRSRSELRSRSRFVAKSSLSQSLSLNCVS